MAITMDDIKKMSPKQKALIGFIFFALIGYFYYMYFYQPAFDKKVLLEENLDNLQRQITERERVVKQIEQYKKDLAALQKNFQIALTKLPEEKEIPGLLRSVSEAGREEDIELPLFEPLPRVEKDFYAEIPVKVIVRGDYQDITLFFERVARLPRIVNLTDITIRRAREMKESKNFLTADCLMKTYMFLDKVNETDKK